MIQHPTQSVGLRDLQLPCHIGVTLEEQALAQTLSSDLSMVPAQSFAAMQDQLERTIDYAAVAQRMRGLALERPRRLLETLAQEMAQCLIEEFGALRAEVELRKQILENCGPSVVRIRLDAAS